MLNIELRKQLENKIRAKRAEICFPVINRGKLWYDNLSTEQYKELKLWYQKWLDATETLVAPNTPDWINRKLNDTEDIL